MNARMIGALLAPVGTALALLAGGCPQDPLSNKTDDGSVQSPFRVDAVTPNHGPAVGGTRVTIRGGPFVDKVGVLFGAHAAVDPVIVNNRMITAFSPAQEPGMVDVMVLANGGQVTVLGAFTYDEALPIDVISVVPADGPVTGGTEVTINGANFEPGAIVRFGGTLAAHVDVLNSELIVATTPPGAAGLVEVKVTSNGSADALHDGFTYFEIAPGLDTIEPGSGPLAGGTQVTLRGENFPADAGVLFGDISATQVTVVNDQLITALAPPGASEGAVDVTLVYSGHEIVMSDAFRYVGDDPIFDDGTDGDGDGLTDVQELTGWETWIEAFGLQLGVDTFGNVTRYAVTSDPNLADTDGDGLPDLTELLIKSDPRKYDSDDDGLWDGEEWNQWLTSPTSVDTDADARGDRNIQNAPNQALFDGAELFDLAVLRLPPTDPRRVVRPRATSPTLFDTDGDGASDFDEYDSTVRNGVLSDLPRLEYELVGDVDVRLNVEYAETIGETKEYGVTLAQSQTETVASSFSNTLGWSVEVGVEQEINYGPLSFGSTSVHVTAGIHGEYTWSSSKESSRESSEEHSRLQSDSRELTESAADGAIRTAIVLKNPGNTTFTLDGLSVLVSQRQKVKAEGDTAPQTPAKTIATMTPSFDSITLAPGEAAGPFELAATGVNAQAIKELLARPDTLMLGTAAMNFHDQTGLDFDFVRQFTVAQTANVVIDFGDGQVRSYNVATNVDRNPDSTYRGITLRRAFEEMLRLPYGDPLAGYTTMNDPDGRQVLRSLLGRQFAADVAGQRRNYWIVVTNNPAHSTANLNDVMLRAGDQLSLFFNRDDDNDGVTNTLEKAAGTDQNPALPNDADGDGLSDKAEVIDGWIAFEDPADPAAPHPDGFAKRRVFSSATAVDSDEDGLTDPQEFAARSDPLDPDSDGDGLLDGEDPFPIRRAGVRFVKADAAAGGDGRAWDTAYTTIQAAIAEAAAGAGTTNPADDVSQIWVAQGTYRPTNKLTNIQLRNNLRIYGGFSGPTDGFAGETKRGQRMKDPAQNGCVISGDLAGDDVGPASSRDGDFGGPASRLDNAWGLVSASNVNSSCTFDGFMLTGSAVYSALRIDGGSPIIENCLFIRNGAENGGGLFVTGSNNTPIFRNCTFASNAALVGGGAKVFALSRPRFENCSFEQNDAQLPSGAPDSELVNGGGLALGGNARVDLVRCSFVGNRAYNWGAGIFADSTTSGYVRVDSCRFFNNIITRGAPIPDYHGGGGAMYLRSDAAVFNSVFWGNYAEDHGGAILAYRRLAINNCTFAANRTMSTGDGGGITAGDYLGLAANVTIENSILWANWIGRDELPDDPQYQEWHQFSRYGNATLTIRNSCFNRPSTYAGNNNIGVDPKLVGLETGELSLVGDSPCIDRGNAFVDVEPLVPGLQRLPNLDFFGNPRIADGNADGFVTVDLGACEATGQ